MSNLGPWNRSHDAWHDQNENHARWWFARSICLTDNRATCTRHTNGTYLNAEYAKGANAGGACKFPLSSDWSKLAFINHEFKKFVPKIWPIRKLFFYPSIWMVNFSFSQSNHLELISNFLIWSLGCTGLFRYKKSNRIACKFLSLINKLTFRKSRPQI